MAAQSSLKTKLNGLEVSQTTDRFEHFRQPWTQVIENFPCVVGLGEVARLIKLMVTVLIVCVGLD